MFFYEYELFFRHVLRLGLAISQGPFLFCKYFSLDFFPLSLLKRKFTFLLEEFQASQRVKLLQVAWKLTRVSRAFYPYLSIAPYIDSSQDLNFSSGIKTELKRTLTTNQKWIVRFLCIFYQSLDKTSKMANFWISKSYFKATNEYVSFKGYQIF